jgi:hypothetical protein
MIIALLVLLVVCGIPLLLLRGCQGSSGPIAPSGEEAVLPGQSEQEAAPPPTREPVVSGELLATDSQPSPTRLPAARQTPGATGGTWLVMLYQDADDKILEQDIYVDLNEAERVGSSERVNLIAQVDRYRTGYQGDGDWTTARRFFITQDDDLQRVRSQVVEDLGEVNMADGQTLVDFVTWAVQTYPADHTMLILSDHGLGWPGGWSDPTASGAGDRSSPLSAALDDHLYLSELEDALRESLAQTGLEKLDLIGMDACLMGHLEVFSALAPYAHYAVASQETEPALGWAYASFLEALAENPDMSGAELGQLIVDSYIQEDQRIVDDQARADFIRQGSPLGGTFGLFGGPTAEQLTRQLERNITLTTVDLDALPGLVSSVNDLAFALQEAEPRAVTQARSYAQSFTSVFGKDVPPSYIDLGNFVQVLQQQSRDRVVQQAAGDVLSALQGVVVAEKHGPDRPGATGVSIYFPNSQLYGSPVTGPKSYTSIARTFSADSLWDDFLAYHYSGRTFEPDQKTAAVPPDQAEITAPGAGQIQISQISKSSNVAAPGRPVLLSADVSGTNLGYIKLFVGYLDRAANAIFLADQDFLESPDTRQVDGVYYPDWGEGDFTLEFEWEPLMFAISDGENSAVALLTPQSYGADPQEATYTVDGAYTYADDGETRSARLYFRDGQLWQVFGFTGEDTTGSPWEIIPQSGDTFTIQEQWLDLDSSGRVTGTATQPGETLTFGSEMFTWQELNAAPGDYVVGFIVEDLDGNATEAYTMVRVE